MTEKLAAPAKPKKQTKADLHKLVIELNQKIVGLQSEIDAKVQRNVSLDRDLSKAEKDRAQLHALVGFLRIDRAALAQSIRVLSEEHDLDKGRATLQPTWEPHRWDTTSYAMAEPGRKS